MASDANSSITMRNTALEVSPTQRSIRRIFSIRLCSKSRLSSTKTIFHSWKQQIEGIIHTHELHQFLMNPDSSLHYPADEYHTNDTKNQVFVTWEQQYSLLFTWILMTLYDFVLPHVVRCGHSHQIWDEVHKYIFTHINAKSRQLRSKLK